VLVQCCISFTENLANAPYEFFFWSFPLVRVKNKIKLLNKKLIFEERGK
jgi:hypothetical protein